MEDPSLHRLGPPPGAEAPLLHRISSALPQVDPACAGGVMQQSLELLALAGALVGTGFSANRYGLGTVIERLPNGRCGGVQRRE